MPDLNKKTLDALTLEGWTLTLEESTGEADDGLTMTVNILEHGERKGRMTLTRTGSDQRETQIHHLERRAIAWIDEYRGRSDSDGTEFGELE